jgi:TonB family protein
MRRALLVVIVLTSQVARAQDVRRDDRPAEPPPEPPKLTRPPELLEAAEPVYPAAEASSGREADVGLRLSIDATGAVTQVEVVTSAGLPFDEAALAAARRYRFRPAEFDGKPGPIVVETTIHFRLTRKVEEPPASPPPRAGERKKGDLVLSGKVRERGTRKKIPGASIGVAGTSDEAVTNDKGAFTLPGLAAGTIRLVVLAPGYDRFEESITLVAGESADVTIYLRPEGGSPYETIVEGERERLEVTRRTVDRRMMTTVPGTFGDPIRVIQNLPGMARTPYLTGFLLIRGSNPDDSGVFIDGHSVPLLYHFLGGPSVLNPEFLEEIHLYPGGFPARFGRFHGGVVEVETRPTASDGVHGSADVDLIDTGLYLRGPIGDRVTIAGAARRSYIDQILPYLIPDPDEGETLIVVPVYYDYQLRLDVDLPGKDTLSVLLFGSDDTLDVLATDADAEATYDLDTHIGFNRLRATYTTPFVGDLILSLSPMIGRDVVSLAGGEQSSFAVRNSIVGLRERVRGPLAEGLRLDAGIDLEYRKTDFRLNAAISDDIRPLGGDVDIPPELLESSADTYQVGFYGELAWDVGSGVRLIPGVRLDTFVLNGEPRWSVDPRIVARWTVTPPTVLKAYLGKFTQPPPPEGLDTRFGNPALELEQGIHTGVGVEQKLPYRLTLDAEVYYIDRRNQAAFSQTVVMRDDGTIDPLYWENKAASNSVGLELLLKHDVTKNFYGWIAYTLSRSTQKRGPDMPRRPTAFDQPHNFTLVASYRLDAGWELGVRFRAVSGRPDTPVLGSTYDSDTDSYVPLDGPSRSAREAFFHQLDVRIEKTWLFRTWMLGVYLDVLNVYNAENPEATQWDYRYREHAPVRGLPIVPTLGVRGQW